MAVAGHALSAAGHLIFLAYLGWTGRMPRGSPLSSGLFVGALLATALWAAALALGQQGEDGSPWRAAAAMLDLVRYALWLGFLYTLISAVRENGTARTSIALRWILVAVIAAAALLQGLRVALGVVDQPQSRIVLLALLGLPLLGLLFLEQLFRNLGEERWGAKPVCIGLGIVFAFDIYMLSQALLFGQAEIDTVGARGPVHLLAVPFLLVAARRRADWISRLHVSRTAVFHSATLVLAGLYLLFVSSIGYYVRFFGGTWGRALQLSLLFAALAMLVAFAVSGSLRSWLKVFVGKHFFSYRFDYREEWLRFTAMLSTRGAPHEVGLLVVRGLADMVECPAGSLWARAEPGGPFRQTARWNGPQIAGEEPADSAFSAFLRRTGWVIDLDQLRSTPRLYDGLVLPGWMPGGAQRPWLVVPLLAGDELLGFVLLAHPRTRVEVNWEVLDLLKTASRQAAGHLAQMQATEALLEARKFDAFNRMSAFVVHDLKNIVTQLSLMLKNAERLHDNREFQQDMLLTVESSLAKMRRLMLQLREGSPASGAGVGVELDPIVQRLAALAKGRGRTLEVRRLERLATRGHEDRLERVLGHLVHNALDATAAGGRVWVSVVRESGQVRIEVGDNGEGMSEEFVQTRLFKPFSSTKGSGMGVGSFESAQYVRELGGSIAVASRLGEGTTITVRLPLFEMQHGSDLLPRDA